MNSRITGIGKCLPVRRVTNRELERVVDTSDAWIRERTGIEVRHIALEETTTDLAAGAAAEALRNAGIPGSRVELVVVATMTPDDYMPATACRVQKRIGAGRAAAFDVSAACSGFVYALAVADQFIRSGSVRTALVIGAETVSKAIDWTDRTTCVIFADGAGAVVLEAAREEGIVRTELGADGEEEGILRTKALGTCNYWVCDRERNQSRLVMDGPTVFRFSTKILGESVRGVLQGTPYGIPDIDWFVPHQANTRIIEYAATRLRVDPSRFYTNVQTRGNTSAASVPLALADMQEEGCLRAGDLVVCTAFGGGLTWGSALIRI